MRSFKICRCAIRCSGLQRPGEVVQRSRRCGCFHAHTRLKAGIPAPRLLGSSAPWSPSRLFRQSVSVSGQEWFEPHGQGLCAKRDLSVFDRCDVPEGRAQVVVIVYQHMRNLAQRLPEIDHGAGVACDKFLRGHVVAALRYAHGHALIGYRSGPESPTKQSTTV